MPVRVKPVRCLGRKCHRLTRLVKLLKLQVQVVEASNDLHRVPGVETLGAGAFGKVYLVNSPQNASHLGVQQDSDCVAIKVARLKRKDLTAFNEILREHQRARHMPGSPLFVRPTKQWLVKVLRGLGKRGQLQYMQEMPAILGGTLSTIIKEFHADRLQGKPPNERSLCRLLAQLLGLTHMMHTAGLVHRDLKPRNLLMASTAPILHVCDFGGATYIGQLFNSSRPNDLICTAKYAAPEAINPHCRELPAHPSQDIFSIGVIMYELLAGPGIHPLVPPDVMAQYNNHKSNHGQRSSSSSSSWSAVLHGAMQQQVLLEPHGQPVLDGYHPAWADMLQGLCAYHAHERWSYQDALSSPLLVEQELRSWAASARVGAARRRNDGEQQEALSMEALALLYEQLAADKAALMPALPAQLVMDDQMAALAALLQPLAVQLPVALEHDDGGACCHDKDEANGQQDDGGEVPCMDDQIAALAALLQPLTVQPTIRQENDDVTARCHSDGTADGQLGDNGMLDMRKVLSMDDQIAALAALLQPLSVQSSVEQQHRNSKAHGLSCDDDALDTAKSSSDQNKRKACDHVTDKLHGHPRARCGFVQQYESLPP